MTLILQLRIELDFKHRLKVSTLILKWAMFHSILLLDLDRILIQTRAIAVLQ
jgi:hypothetical protein